MLNYSFSFSENNEHARGTFALWTLQLVDGSIISSGNFTNFGYRVSYSTLFSRPSILISTREEDLLRKNELFLQRLHKDGCTTCSTFSTLFRLNETRRDVEHL